MSENAEMPYHPADDDQSNSGGIHVALAMAESQLSSQSGVNGLGMTKTSAGQDAIVVYVQSAEVISRLPSSVNGFSVVGLVTGNISAQRVYTKGNG